MVKLLIHCGVAILGMGLVYLVVATITLDTCAHNAKLASTEAVQYDSDATTNFECVYREVGPWKKSIP